MKRIRQILKKIYPIRLIYYFLKFHLRRKFVNINGYKLFINRKDYRGCSDILKGTYELEETEIVKQAVKKGDVVVDLGANIGYYTLLLSKLVGKNGKVFSFEPEPKNFALLKNNVKTNKCSNVILENKGVSDRTGKAKLWLRSDSNKGGHRLIPINKSIHHSKPIEIDIITFDDYFKDKIDFVKIDVEGAEIMVLKGMKNALKEKIKLLIERPLGIEHFTILKDFNIKEINNGANLFCIKKIIKNNRN